MKITPEIAKASGAWPFEEALKLVERFKKKPPAKGYCLFETGYGPSGLPHIGTFGEAARTAMVRHAFTQISDIPTKLFCVSDDMDGLRKVPDNIPNPEMVSQYMNKPLTSVPDPFGTHESYGAHMNARLRAFLDRFGFDYEFKSATELYKTGAFDEKLKLAAKKYDAIMKIMIPTLGAERQATYSPFLPISPKTGNVLYVPMKNVDAEKGTITFDDEDGTETTIPVTGGHCKLQWKPDFGMRWAALDVDFEMYGKDHLVNGKLYSDICRTLGGNPPEQFNYELFLDEKGEKISKSKGNGISMEQWLSYATQESLSLYMFQSPKKAKKLHFDVIPKAVDEYLIFVEKYQAASDEEKLKNPSWHIHGGKVPNLKLPITFSLLLNLASACNPESPDVLWGFITKHAGAKPGEIPLLDQLVTYAVKYYDDFVKPAKEFRPATEHEKKCLVILEDFLKALPEGADAETIQTGIYDIGMKNGYETNLREWFGALYEILLGSKQGPRLGTFTALFGKENMLSLIRGKIEENIGA